MALRRSRGKALQHQQHGRRSQGAASISTQCYGDPFSADGESTGAAPRWVPADTATQGKLRALGRLLGTVGEKFRVAAAAASASAASAASSSAASAAWGLQGDVAFASAGAGAASTTAWNGAEADVAGEDDDCSFNGSVLRTCGDALLSISAALRRGCWAEAEDLAGASGFQCDGLFPREHLLVLQAFLAGSPSSISLCDSLKALGCSLEEKAERLNTVCAQALQDALFDAAGALRAGARLFTLPRAQAAANQVASAAGSWSRPGAATQQQRQEYWPLTPLDVDNFVAQATPEERRTLLRTLARQYHPDRHPGSEMEVLPVFLHVQRLREQDRR